ncbi:shufflon system plasmid conjugative transfer pilus tip adhesin PilV [Salmonella enterica subsp. enterica serovar Anatum]|nr:shufflon system plasmid conjugative transfer pilus tip adhesin PilV [Salmonella enterica subsp. enterica serovar Anatum]EFR3287407.1 shufflon system plasmid conjugative transfer pilus tip adhesin PilV [Salmonella enterica]EGC6188672.1 shufflon system plasmid conjugative transfer pilus tip adhesin PilV [Salmonella enterica]EGN1132495.1 shufflon system plasmid conjugative transfer pilus tip adhesin PilV [Salmonella enterica subsp. enterica serovar Anatum]
MWKDYIEMKSWQTEARLASNWASAARSYIGKNYASLQATSSTTTPAVITTTMLKNTGFLASGFTETNSEGQRLQAFVVRNAQNPELLQALVVSAGGNALPTKAIIQINLHVRDMTFSNALRLIKAQTAWRANIHQYPGLLQVSFMPPETRKK